MRASRTARRLRFHVDKFDVLARALGLESDADKARFLKLNPSIYHRTSRGQARPGEQFVAAVLAAFAVPDVKQALAHEGIDPEVTFEWLFAVEVDG